MYWLNRIGDMGHCEAAGPSMFSVDRFGIEDSIAFHSHCVIVQLNPSEETALITLVASRFADLIHLEQDRVSVTVEVDGFEFLNVATLFTLAPELLSAATVVADSTSAQSFFPGLFVHPGHHQNDA